MPTFEPGDRVRVDITDETDPDFEFHGSHRKIVNVLEDHTGEVTGDDRDSRIYRIDLDDHTLGLRHRDLRPPFDG